MRQGGEDSQASVGETAESMCSWKGDGDLGGGGLVAGVGSRPVDLVPSRCERREDGMSASDEKGGKRTGEGE